MGVPWEEAFTAGSMISQKLILNEFVAYIDFMQIKDQLTEKTQVIITFALSLLRVCQSLISGDTAGWPWLNCTATARGNSQHWFESSGCRFAIQPDERGAGRYLSFFVGGKR